MPAATKRQPRQAVLSSRYSPVSTAAQLRISYRLAETRRRLREAELRAADAEAAKDADALLAEKRWMDEAWRRRETGWTDEEIADADGITVEDLPWRSF